MDHGPQSPLGEQPLVSILMLTYNRAGYLAAAIDSVLKQTYQHWELIVIDDGSTDETARILQGYQDARITYHQHADNKGLMARRRESLSYITGSYAAILDSDDIWTSEQKLEKQVTFMETYPECAVVGSFITHIDETGREIGRNRYGTTDSVIRNHLLVRNQFAHSSELLRSSYLKLTAGYRDIVPGEDLDLYLQLGQYGTFANLPEYLVSYRIHQESSSVRKTKVAASVMSVIGRHRHNYPGAWRGYLKMALIWCLASARLY